MELMYIKYKNNTKSTVIKDGDKLIKSESKIIPLRSKEKISYLFINFFFTYFI